MLVKAMELQPAHIPLVFFHNCLKNGYFAARFYKKLHLQSLTKNYDCMDFKQIQELIKIINKSNIGELSIEEKDFKITIKQKEEAGPVYSSSMPSNNQASYMQPQVSYTPAAPGTAPANAAENVNVAGKPADNLITVKSPMIGTFYRSSSPDKPYFVNVGDEIAPGKTVCIIEAMKLFNEIESEVKGTIVKVLVEDASPVEYDQPLFLVEPA